MPPRFVARQLSHPSGFIGRLIMGEMNRRNAKMNAFALTQLALAPADRVLEIGFGGGALLAKLIEGAASVKGIDMSQAAVDRAAAHFAPAVRSGCAEFRVGDVAVLPFANASFDKVVTVNTVYFWSSLEAGFSEIHRVLTAGGRLAVGFLPKEPMDRMNMPADIFTTRAPEDVIATLKAAGFRNARAKRPEPSTPWNVVIAER